ncbi:unnamed protein product [Rotaria sp. Silwood1]|nr:unnamed protein product [Rotaria sp. Silwood1]CAF1081671.1 unnamed protein product [Rotaria sp. Silwood1]CAF4906879.1 unnamed protein product [Rotaria sp. Silwood1]
MEDIMDHDASTNVYKQQAALRLPPMTSPTPASASVLPRFDSLMGRSSAGPWSPAPLNGSQYEKPSVDTRLTSPTFVKSSYVWPSKPNNSYTKTADSTIYNNNSFTRGRDSAIPSNNSFTKRMDSTMVSNNSSNAQMISSSDETCTCLSKPCSPRCKLGILGFTIGLLAVCIPLAVILVLWLRK